MTAGVCELFESADVEVYFYGELSPANRARVESHLRTCEACRERLADLHAIREALASRPRVEAPPAGDWSGFMRRLNRAIAPPALRAPHPRDSRARLPRRMAALAATIAVVSIGLALAARFRSPDAAPVAVKTAVTTVAAKTNATDRALREGSAEHLERSKLVVLGLATLDPRARPAEWQYERTLAGSLLPETRLYRQAALRDGAGDVARVMRDLETVLLEASMSENSDRQALERVQRLIDRRDLVLKMQVVGEAGRAGN